jgi:hypothetical protein
VFFLPVGRNSPVALSLDGKVPLSGSLDDAEEAVLTPRGTPAVADDPVRSHGVVDDSLSPTDDADDMVDDGHGLVLVEDTSSVVLELRSGINSTRDRSTGVDLSHHVGGSADGSVVPDLVDGVVGKGVASSVGSAGAAGVEEGAVLVLGLVVVAGLIGDSGAVGIPPNSKVISSVARASSSAVNDVLGAQVSAGPSTTTLNVDAVGKGTGGSHSPATSAVLGNVLVAGGAEEVGSVHGAPVVRGGEGINLEVGVGKGLSDVLGHKLVAVKSLIANVAVAECKHLSQADKGDEKSSDVAGHLPFFFLFSSPLFV